LDYLESNINMKISRDISVLGYFPDGFIDDLKLCIEIDEPFHIEKDLLKDSDYQNNGYYIFRVPVIKWMENKK